MFGTMIRRGGPLLAGALGMYDSEEAEAGLLYEGLDGARKAVKKFRQNNPTFREPIIAQRGDFEYMLDEDLNPVPGHHGREFMGKGKGTGYHPVATNPEDRQREVLFAYADLANELDRIGVAGGERGRKARRKALNNFMHTQNDYERWSPIVRDTYDEGHQAGDVWKMGMDAKYEEMMERVPKKYHSDVERYFKDHIVRREREARAHHRYSPRRRQPQLDPLPKAHNSHEEAVKAAAAAAAAAGAGGAKAGDDPEFDEYMQPTPKEGFGEFPVYQDRNAPLPVPTGGDIVDSVFRVLDMPLSGLLGMGRGLYGIATGEDATEALAQGVHVSEQGADYGAEKAGEYVTDKTGDESLGWMAKWGLLLGSPF